MLDFLALFQKFEDAEITGVSHTVIQLLNFEFHMDACAAGIVKDLPCWKALKLKGAAIICLASRFRAGLSDLCLGLSRPFVLDCHNPRCLCSDGFHGVSA